MTGLIKAPAANKTARAPTSRTNEINLEGDEQSETNNRLLPLERGIALFAFAAMLAVSALAKTNAKPTVVLIRAEWCSACQRLEPTMKELMGQYSDRLNFVVLDVSTDETTKEAAATARRLGIGRFFHENQQSNFTGSGLRQGLSHPLSDGWELRPAGLCSGLRRRNHNSRQVAREVRV